MPPRETDLVIEAIGGQGDGLATAADGRPVFVPLTVPGDRVRARVAGPSGGGYAAQAVELLGAGPGRREPPCDHFGPCGGCRLQHVEAAVYAEWKHAKVCAAVARAGHDAARVAPLRQVAPGTRRRVELAAIRLRDGVVLGFRERASHRVVDVGHCTVACAAINGALGVLRGLLADILPPGPAAEIAVTETETGLDVVMALNRVPGLDAVQRMADAARDGGLARLSWSAPEQDVVPAVARTTPTVSFADVPVDVPAGGFLQPTREGEQNLAAVLLAGLPDTAAAVADLYSGCGTFTFPLARRARVHAVEFDAAALGALEQAARRAGLWGRITTARRNLERSPLSAAELKGFDAVLFDPPRAGARQQAETLAQSTVATVLALSCNPASFARDAHALREGGYVLETVVPVDQFLWSPHVELAAVFRRG